MGFGDLLSKIFGNKAQRDMREIQPYVDKINGVYASLVSLTNDELRARTQAIREKIRQYVAAEVAKVASLRAEVEGQEIEHMISSDLHDCIDSSQITGAVMGQYVEGNQELEAFASENGISPGKAWR